jgi:phosphoribosylformylglycinamidine synthase
LIESAHDVSDGGLFITLLESAMPKNLGFDITTASEIREDAFLFGEAPSRVVVSVRETSEDAFLDLMKKSHIPYTLIGHVTKGEIRVDEYSFGEVSEFKDLFDTSLAKHF